MGKVLTIARVEFQTFVQTKAFWASVILMPVLLLGSTFISSLRGMDTEARRFAVVDHTGQLYAGLERAAQARTAKIEAEGDDADEAKFFPSLETPRDGESIEELRLRLSEEIRKDALFAFVEIPADVLAADLPAKVNVSYNSDSPTYPALRVWVDEVLNGELRRRRYEAAGLAPQMVAKLERAVPSENMGLWERAPDGRILPAQKVDKLRAFVVPAALVVIMFMLIGMSAPHLLNAVIEEKVSRISEVLLGSVTPFQLMLGKLLGNTGVAMLLAALYTAGALTVAASFGHRDLVPLWLLGYFALFLVLATVLYGSLYLAVGAACSDVREAQALLMPVMTVQMAPFLLFIPVIESPASTFSTTASLVPTASPFLMLLRLALQPAPPAWQVVLAVSLTVATTLACVWAASRVFRVGLLMQGRPPSFGTLVRWVFSSK